MSARNACWPKCRERSPREFRSVRKLDSARCDSLTAYIDTQGRGGWDPKLARASPGGFAVSVVAEDEGKDTVTGAYPERRSISNIIDPSITNGDAYCPWSR